MSEEVKKVLANCAQNFSDGEKLQARTNIGAIGGARAEAFALMDKNKD